MANKTSNPLIVKANNPAIHISYDIETLKATVLSGELKLAAQLSGNGLDYKFKARSVDLERIAEDLTYDNPVILVRIDGAKSYVLLHNSLITMQESKEYGYDEFELFEIMPLGDDVDYTYGELISFIKSMVKATWGIRDKDANVKVEFISVK